MAGCKSCEGPLYPSRLPCSILRIVDRQRRARSGGGHELHNSHFCTCSWQAPLLCAHSQLAPAVTGAAFLSQGATPMFTHHTGTIHFVCSLNTSRQVNVSPHALSRALDDPALSNPQTGTQETTTGRGRPQSQPTRSGFCDLLLSRIRHQRTFAASGAAPVVLGINSRDGGRRAHSRQEPNARLRTELRSDTASASGAVDRDPHRSMPPLRL